MSLIPKPRAHRRRISPEWEKMQPGDSLLLPTKAARALREYITRRGWQPVQLKEGKQIRVWRLK